MALHVRPASLSSAARLTSRIGNIGGVAGGHPWKDTRRVVAAGGRLRVMMTDGLTTLEWPIPTDGDDPDGFDIGIEAASFDALATRPDDGGPYEISRGDGLVLTQAGGRNWGGSRSLKLPARACPGFPPGLPSHRPDAPGRPCFRWTSPAAPLARAFAFVAPFIAEGNPVGSRSVATWTTEGILVGGSPREAALVSGLSAPGVPVSFGRRAALVVAAFLEQLRGEVEVRAEGAHYAFSSPLAGQRLVVRGESAPFPTRVLGMGIAPAESFRIDRKAFLNSVAILEIFLPTRGDQLEFRIRGEGDSAAILLATPGIAATHSSDEVAIIRSVSPPASQAEGPSVPPGGSVAETLFWAKGRRLREALTGLGAVTLMCHLDRRHKHLVLEEVPPAGGAVRSVLLSAMIPHPDEERCRPSPGAGEEHSVDSGDILPGGPAAASPLDLVVAPEDGERCPA